MIDANERITNAFEGLHESFEDEQRREYESEGLTFLHKKQFMKLMKDQG